MSITLTLTEKEFIDFFNTSSFKKNIFNPTLISVIFIFRQFVNKMKFER